MRILENISMISILILMSIIGLVFGVILIPIVFIITGTVGTFKFYSGIKEGIKEWGKEKS